MARVQLDVFSQALQVGTSLEVIYPEPLGGPSLGNPRPGGTGTDESEPADHGAADPRTPSAPGSRASAPPAVDPAPDPAPGSLASARPPALLYLLHGLSDDQTAWVRWTSIERYARRYELAVVMPAVGRSFYRDMVSGPAYWSWVSDELPRLVHAMFRLSSDPAETFVAGLSMGGYGALRLALTFPQRFAAAASFSGAVDVVERIGRAIRDRDERRIRDLDLVYGPDPDLAGTPDDLLALASGLAKAGARIPDLSISCGTEDILIEDNERLHARLLELGVEHDYHTEPGVHEWGLWDRHVERFLLRLEGLGLLRVRTAPS